MSDAEDDFFRCPRCQTRYWTGAPLCPHCGRITDQGELAQSREMSDGSPRELSADSMVGPSVTRDPVEAVPLVALVLVLFLALVAAIVTLLR